MPDISMCENSECPSCKICWRFMAKPSEYQSYSLFKTDGDKCGYFWPLSARP